MKFFIQRNFVFTLKTNLWFWPTRSQVCRRVCGPPSDRTRLQCPVDVRRADTGNIRGGRRSAGPVAPPATERSPGRIRRTLYRISLRQTTNHWSTNTHTTWQHTIGVECSPEKVLFAVSVTGADEALVDQVRTAVGTFQTFRVPRTFQNFEDEPVQDEAVASSASRNSSCSLKFKKKELITIFWLNIFKSSATLYIPTDEAIDLLSAGYRPEFPFRPHRALPMIAH